jgi:hypothetical protein
MMFKAATLFLLEIVALFYEHARATLKAATAG